MKIDDILREIEERGIIETLNDKYEAVANRRDNVLLVDNPDQDAIMEALASVMTTISVDLCLPDDQLLKLIDASDFFTAILLGAYCMGYKRGQGKGLTLVVREDTNENR